jgi:hypothetical protein
VGRNFYSGTDAELAAGADNVVAVVTPVPATYGLTAPIVTSYSALATSYRSALTLSTAPATRTSIAVENKQAAKRALRAATINLSRIVTATPTVTNAMLLGLGFTQRLIPTPRPVPPTPPAIEVLAVAGRVATVRVRDTASAGRGLPFGAVSAHLYSFVGPAAPADPRAYHFEGPTTRAKFQLVFPNDVPSGATVWLSATWVNARGQASAGSTPTSFTLQGGPVAAAA